MTRAESDIDRSRLPIKDRDVSLKTNRLLDICGTLNRRWIDVVNVVNVDSTSSTSIQLSFYIISTVIQYVLSSKCVRLIPGAYCWLFCIPYANAGYSNYVTVVHWGQLLSNDVIATSSKHYYGKSLLRRSLIFNSKKLQKLSRWNSLLSHPGQIHALRPNFRQIGSEFSAKIEQKKKNHGDRVNHKRWPQLLRSAIAGGVNNARWSMGTGLYYLINW